MLRVNISKHCFVSGRRCPSCSVARAGPVMTILWEWSARPDWPWFWNDILACWLICTPEASQLGTARQEYLSKAFELADHGPWPDCSRCARQEQRPGGGEGSGTGPTDASGAGCVATDQRHARLAVRPPGTTKRPTGPRGVIEDLKTSISRLSQARSALMEEIEANFPDYAELINPTGTIPRPGAVCPAARRGIAWVFCRPRTFLCLGRSVRRAPRLSQQSNWVQTILVSKSTRFVWHSHPTHARFIGRHSIIRFGL